MVSFSEDDMFRRANRSAYYTWALPEYDVVFTTKSYNAEAAELPAMGARRVVFVDKGYCHRRHRPMQLSEDECRRLCADVGFVGSYERDRAELLLHLASNGVYVRVFGNGWGQWVGSHTNLEVHDRPVYGDEYVKAICATRVNLCFLRKANRDLQTSRTMEIPACGGLMLAERTMEHRRLFEEDVEAAYFDSRNPAELLHKVGYYLENETTRRSLADAGRERCITSGYSHKERLEKMLGYVAAQT
jgi:spore maturation protein CgeB